MVMGSTDVPQDALGCVINCFLMKLTDRRTDGRTDGLTDRRTDRQTDAPSYTDARTHLKCIYFLTSSYAAACRLFFPPIKASLS